MSQVNVNPPSDGGDRSAAAGINLITVLIVVALLAVLLWWLFTGPLAFGGGDSGSNDINVNVKTEQPAAPSGGSTGGGTGGGTTKP